MLLSQKRYDSDDDRASSRKQSSKWKKSSGRTRREDGCSRKEEQRVSQAGRKAGAAWKHTQVSLAT